VIEADLPILFEHQWDREANEIANFPPRDREAFMVHWKKIMADTTVSVRTILLDRTVAGNVGSWEWDGQRLVGYWIGKEYWGKGIASKALSLFLDVVRSRPLYAHVARHNAASIRVLEKCGFELCGDGDLDLVFKLGDVGR
jgi:RimJ/RimL family protein N-acetyltransferase